MGEGKRKKRNKKKNGSRHYLANRRVCGLENGVPIAALELTPSLCATLRDALARLNRLMVALHSSGTRQERRQREREMREREMGKRKGVKVGGKGGRKRARRNGNRGGGMQP